jgi:protein O-mannosyl-transferase
LVLLGFLLVGATLWVYWPLSLNEFIDYDDPEYITANPRVLSGLSWPGVIWAFTTGHAANWHPLTWLSHMLDVQFFGLSPAGHHLMSLLLHGANSVLLLLVLHALTRAVWRGALVAALFALHPLHVESVAWAAERKDVLSTFFGLLCLLAYARYLGEGRREKEEGREGTFICSSIFYPLSLACFALSLMSKPMLVTMPAILLLLDFWPLGRLKLRRDNGSTIRKLVIEKLPFLGLSAAASVMTMLVQHGAIRGSQDLPLVARAANGAVSYARYLQKTFWPWDLAILYPHPGHWPAAAVAASTLMLLLISGLVIWGSRKRPFLFVGWFWFLGLLVPVLGLVQVGVQALADRYTYLPLVGLFIILAWAGAELADVSRFSARFVCFAAILILASCALATRSQLRVWRNTETVFTHALEITHDNWVAHYNLALLALRHYQETQRSAVENQLLKSPAGKRQGLAESLSKTHYLKAIVLQCEATVRARPGYPDPYVTMAKALTEEGKLDEALGHLETAIRLAPKNPEALENLAEIAGRQGRANEAIDFYRAALTLRPDWEPVLNNLAWMLVTCPEAELRDGPEGARLARGACELTNGTNFWFLQTLAAALAECGNSAEATATAEQACKLAAQSGNDELVRTGQERLEIYRAGRTFQAPKP